MIWAKDVLAAIPDPTQSANGGVALILLIGALALAAGAIWKILWPLTRAVVQISDQWPQIAKLADVAEKLVELASAAPAINTMKDDIHELKQNMEKVLHRHAQTRQNDPPDLEVRP